MKELHLYQCEVCGTQYVEKQKAKNCEMSHKKPLKVSGTRYNSMNQGSSDGYPVKVTVTFEDGACVDYRR